MGSTTVWTRSVAAFSCGLAAALASPTVLSAGASSDGTLPLTEIVVTAQKRSENIQDVPASISVLSGSQLELLQATQLTDYAAYIPGFQVDSLGTPGAAQITLRGIDAAPYAGASVGTYIDDSPLGPSSKNTFGSSFALDLMPYDLERVEVLRGPQGTLYGASTMGGLVKYVLRPPDLHDAEFRAGIDGSVIHNGDGEGWGARIGGNLPLIDGVLAVRASLFDQHTPGYVDNSQSHFNGENAVRQDGGRLAMLWRPEEALSVKLTGMFQQTHADGNSVVTVDSADQRPIAGDLTTQHQAGESFAQNLQFYSADVNWGLGWADLTSATSYSHSDIEKNEDNTPYTGFIIPLVTGGAVTNGYTVSPITLNLDKITQELRLTSPSGGKIEWQTGAFFTNENYHGFQQLRAFTPNGTSINPDPLGQFNQPDTYQEYAIFADLTYKLTDQFDVMVGGRAARNHEKFRSQAASVVFATTDATAYDSANIFTYMISPRWHVNADTMIYARVASGYRPGGGNIALFPVIPTQVKADTLVNYELGVKADFLEHKLTLDTAVFYIDWKDIQVEAVEPTTHLDYIANGPAAKSEGVELSLTAAPVSGLRLGLNGSFLEAELTQSASPALHLQSDWLAGARLPLSPRWSGSATADYDFPLHAALRGNLGSSFRYVGDRLTLVATDVSSIRLSPYSVLDFHAGVLNDRWSLRIFAKNVTDKRALLSTQSPATFPVLYATVLQPRTIGLALDFRY